MLETLFNKVRGLKVCSFIKKRLQHRCFPVKYAKFWRTPFFYRTLPVAASDGLPNRRIFEIFSEGFKNSCFQKKVSKRIHIFFLQSFYNPKYRLNLKIEIVQIFKISSRHLLYLLIVMLLTLFILDSNLLQSEPSFCKNNSIYGSSRSEVLYNKCVLRNFTKFTGKHLCQISFLQETLFL